MIRKFLFKLKHGTEYLNYGREIIASWVVDYLKANSDSEIRIIDIGMGTGTDLKNIRDAAAGRKLRLFGVENYEPHIEEAKGNEITILRNNIESERIPAEDGYFHIVIANQIIEHLKEIFWVFGEISRVLMKGGIAIVGVPNMASLHNRIMLLSGEQPTSVEMLSEHVRGITIPSFKRFITCEGFFNVTAIKGSNFYPMPPFISKILSGVFPSFSVSIFFNLARTDKTGNFIEVLNGRIFETPYFRG